MQTSALIKAVHHYLDSLFQLNVIDMMEEVYRVTRVNMSEAEKRQFYEKYVKPMHLVTDKTQCYNRIEEMSTVCLWMIGGQTVVLFQFLSFGSPCILPINAYGMQGITSLKLI